MPVLEGTYFILVESMPHKYRKAVLILRSLQRLDEHILPYSLLHLAYISSAKC